MAITFKHNSLTSDEFIQMRDKTNMRDIKAPVDKTAWYKAPAGLSQFRIPEQNVTVTMDILEFRLSNKYHKHFLDAKCWDARGQYFWNYGVKIHECFPQFIPCVKNFEMGREHSDPVCDVMWENSEIDFKRVNRSYVILLLRVHPNKKLGIEKYTYMYYVDTAGKFVKAIEDEWNKAVDRLKDKRAEGINASTFEMQKVSFFNWGEMGCSIEARFSEIQSALGVKFWGCNDVTFVERDRQLTQQEADWLETLDMCAGVPRPSDEDYAKYMNYFKRACPMKDGSKGYTCASSEVEAEPVVAPRPTGEIPPVEPTHAPPQPIDPVFARKADVDVGNDDEAWFN